jgi:hypothetical protein
MSADPKIIERIAKLLALAGNNPNPHEAALAMERAQALMKEHGVSTSDAEVGPIKEHPLRSWASASKSKDYETILFGGIAQAFGCELLFQAGLGGKYKLSQVGAARYYAHYIIVGPEVDVKVATYAATNLSRAMRKAREQYLDKVKEEYPLISRKGLAVKGDSYCVGWASEVTRKVEPLVRPTVKKRVEEYVLEVTAGRKAPERKAKPRDWTAMGDGLKDGKDVQVRRPLE